MEFFIKVLAYATPLLWGGLAFFCGLTLFEGVRDGCLLFGRRSLVSFCLADNAGGFYRTAAFYGGGLLFGLWMLRAALIDLKEGA